MTPKKGEKPHKFRRREYCTRICYRKHKPPSRLIGKKRIRFDPNDDYIPPPIY